MFIITVYDLTDGREVAQKSKDNFAEAIETYQRAVQNWREPADEDDFALFDVMMFTGNGDIIFGFGEDI